MSEVNSAVAVFAEEFNLFKAENSSLIETLVLAVEGHLDKVDEVLDDYVDELKSALGAKAANAVGDDKAAQEDAIEEAEDWVSENVSDDSRAARIAAVLWQAGCEAGENAIREHLPHTEIVKVRLTLDVTYSLNGENATEMVGRLERMCERAIGEGMLTGETDAEVEEHSMFAVILPD